MLNIFVTGINVSTGKTVITAGLAATMQSLGYQTCIYKPIQVSATKINGFAQPTDLAFIKKIDSYIKAHASYQLKTKTIPAIAAEAENITIDRQFIKNEYEILANRNDCIITEGIGGIMTPLGNNFLTSDLIKDLNLPLVIIVTPTIGIINQTLLTINYANSIGINLRGVIINHSQKQSDTEELKNLPRLVEEYSDAKIVGIVKDIENNRIIEPNNLITDILNGIDIETLFNVKIAKLNV